MGNKLKDRIRLNSIYGTSVQNPIEEFEYENYKWKELQRELCISCNGILVEDKYVPTIFVEKFNDIIYKFLLKYKRCFIHKTDEIYRAYLNKFGNNETIEAENVFLFLKYLYDQAKILIGYQIENFNYLR